MRSKYCLLGIVCSFALSGADKPTEIVEIEAGSASFEASTNMPGVEVKGASNAIAGHAVLSREAGGLVLEQVRVTLPVKSLSTGMKVRDEHMRKYIFTAADGHVPDLEFAAGKTACQPAAGAGEFVCAVSGDLAMAGTPRKFAMKLSVKESSGAFHASGNAVVRLSDYGIACPSQFGVSTKNEVKLHLDIAARQRPAALSSTEHVR